MKNKSFLWIWILLIISSVLIIGISSHALYVNRDKETIANATQHNEDTQVSEATSESESIDTEIVDQTQKIHLMMIGDNLMHMGIVRSGELEDGTRNYDKLFEPIKEHLAYADIKMINQETIFGGNQLGFSGYPHFNSPTEVGDAIAKAGFNVVLHASNHSADKGINGLKHCVEFWKKYPEVLMTGIFENPDVPNQDIGILEIDGVTFAVLNYTYSPNLATLPKDIRGHLSILCNWDTQTGKINYTELHPDVLTDIQQAKELADVVIVCPHWGTEYTFVPSSYQKKFAKQMTEAGADLIIGTHPHVIQPVEWIESENGNRALCYYSLGNYVSTQQDPETMLEAMAWVTFEVTEDTVSLVEEETGAIPMVCHYKSGPVRLERVYFLDEYTAEKAQSHGIHAFDQSKTFTVDNLNTWAKDVLGQWLMKSHEVLGIFPVDGQRS
ncbi:MAG: CapA family protein [Agathobacter sp.]|nr:CapA family protein [Agathobacter sp.]